MRAWDWHVVRVVRPWRWLLWRSSQLSAAATVQLWDKTLIGHTPSTVGTLQRKFRKDPGNALRVFPGGLKSTAGIPIPEHFQNSLPLSTAGDASFFRSGSGEGLSEPVMEFLSSTGGISDLKKRPSNCMGERRIQGNRSGHIRQRQGTDYCSSGQPSPLGCFSFAEIPASFSSFLLWRLSFQANPSDRARPRRSIEHRQI